MHQALNNNVSIPIKLKTTEMLMVDVIIDRMIPLLPIDNNIQGLSYAAICNVMCILLKLYWYIIDVMRLNFGAQQNIIDCDHLRQMEPLIMVRGHNIHAAVFYWVRRKIIL